MATPLVLSPLLLMGMEYRCVFCILLISIYWIAEVVPIGVSSLLPLLLFPILGIVSAKDIAENYFKDSIVLFMCTLVLAISVEETGLHRRIALKLLTSVGSRKQTMLLGYMSTAAFISFFVSDTAATALMLPIAVAIVTTISRVTDTAKSTVHRTIDHVEGSNNNSDNKEASNIDEKEFCDLVEEMNEENRGFAKAIVLAASHGSLIGGTAIITSTGPNLVFREQLQTFYPHDEVSVSYLQWMTFAMPPMFLYLLASFLVLSIFFLGPSSLIKWFKKRTDEEKHVSAVISKNLSTAYHDLGKISFAEVSVMAWFTVLFLLWVFRKPGFMAGWGNLFPDNGAMLTDSTCGILIVFMLFVWPRENPFDAEAEYEPILNWKIMKMKYSWSCQLLIAAGYAISEGVQKSGLSILISCTMKGIFQNLQHVWLQLAVTSSICFMTEFASNVSTGSIFIPIVISVAESFHMNPLYLALPTAVACSFAFMLPMATPPNAIVYDTKIVSMFDMICTGFCLNLMCIAITVFNMNTYTFWLFDMSHVPHVPSRQNVTLAC
ncbi:unnamed protein product [Auanema sp. JU1783]|nr:unnamed protein product [Auanema sp. JU1783]